MGSSGKRRGSAPTTRWSGRRGPSVTSAAGFTEWRELLRRHVPQARQILKKLFVGPVRFTPHREDTADYYEFRAQVAFGRVFSGLASAIWLASPDIPSWNQLRAFLEQMRSLAGSWLLGRVVAAPQALSTFNHVHSNFQGGLEPELLITLLMDETVVFGTDSPLGAADVRDTHRLSRRERGVQPAGGDDDEFARTSASILTAEQVYTLSPARRPSTGAPRPSRRRRMDGGNRRAVDRV